MDNKNNLIAIEAMKSVINDYLAKIEHLKLSIIMLGGDIDLPPTQYDSKVINLKAPVNLANEAGKYPYPYGKKMRYKVQYIFERENRFMLVREVNEYLIQIEPDLKNELDSIRNAIANMKTDKLLTSIKTGKSNTSYVWGKPEWINEDGKIKAMHHYDTTLPEVG
jgi:hypothetical protein